LAILTAGVPSSQALPGFLITAPPSACVSTELGALAVWIQNHKKKRGCQTSGAGSLSSYKAGGFWWYKNIYLNVRSNI